MTAEDHHLFYECHFASELRPLKTRVHCVCQGGARGSRLTQVVSYSTVMFELVFLVSSFFPT